MNDSVTSRNQILERLDRTADRDTTTIAAEILAIVGAEGRPFYRVAVVAECIDWLQRRIVRSLQGEDLFTASVLQEQSARVIAGVWGNAADAAGRNNDMQAELGDVDHERMDRFLGKLLTKHKAGELETLAVIGTITHVVAAIDQGNYAEARRWISEGEKAG